jgi:hypothetical protein
MQLKPFITPFRKDTASLQLIVGYELDGGSSGAGALDFLLHLCHHAFSKQYDGYAIPSVW